jgi:hypothetical protein
LIVLPFFLTFALVVESLDMIEAPEQGRHALTDLLTGAPSHADR